MVASVLAFADVDQPLKRIASVLKGEGAVATADGHIATFTDRGVQAALIYPISLSAEERVGLDRLTTPDGNNVPDLTYFDAVMIECSSGDEVARLDALLHRLFPPRCGSSIRLTRCGRRAMLIRREWL